MTASEFEPFCERNQNGMFWVAKSVLNNDFDAEDAVQTTFKRIFKVFGQLEFESEQAEKSYTLRAARNAAIDVLRAQEPTEEVSEKAIDSVSCSRGDTTFATVAAAETAAELLTAVKGLTYKAQAVFKFRAMGIKDAEIADSLGISVGDVRTTAFRARKKLSALLEKGGLHNE